MAADAKWSGDSIVSALGRMHVREEDAGGGPRSSADRRGF
jgi:hypothetical protein